MPNSFAMTTQFQSTLRTISSLSFIQSTFHWFSISDQWHFTCFYHT